MDRAARERGRELAVARPPLASTPGWSSPGFGANVNDERRCLVIDEQPTIRLGVRGLLADRYEVEEAERRARRARADHLLGDFDVAIVELAGGQRRRRRSPGCRRSGRCARRARRSGSSPTAARPERHAATEAVDAGATAYVAKSSPADALARGGRRRRRGRDVRRSGRARRNGAGGSPAASARSCSSTRTASRPRTRRSDSGSAPRRSAPTPRPSSSRLEARDRAHAVAIGLRTSLIE